MIHLLIEIGIIGFLVWVFEQLPISEPFRTIIRGLAILVAVLIVLNFFGIYAGFPVK